MLGDWKRTPMRARMAGMSRRSLQPRMVTSPESGVSSVAMMRRRVDFPEPLGPEECEGLARADGEGDAIERGDCGAPL